MPPAADLNESTDDEDFSWSEYLVENNATAALASCFCQAAEPPANEFEVNHKLETIDPRNTTSTCLGTIIELSGPRIRLRLIGTDDRNDFWLMVDSDLIHPYGYASKNNRKLQPPLGYGNDLSKWPKFLEKLINQSDEKSFAPASCFKPTPTKPIRNEFKVGQKIEAVDPKNPELICPATIKEIKRDRILITFDGWGQSSQCWYPFASRDIFPVGWCKKANHILQYPGDIVEKKAPNASLNHSKINSTPKANTEETNTNSKLIKSPPAAAKPSVVATPINNNSTKKKAANKKTPKTTAKQVVEPPAVTAETNHNNSSDSSGLNITVNDTQNGTMQSPTTAGANGKNNNNQVSTPNASTQQNSKNLAHIDLSIVKQEALDMSGAEDASNVHLKNVNLNSNGEINSQNNYSLNSSFKNKMNAFVHLIPNGDCGPYLKTSKFHQSHTKFGPGSPSSVYKSILQSFVDCAHNRYEVFKLIPEGTSQDIVRLKNTNYNERKRLIIIENINDMWSNLKSFCKVLDIKDESLFSRQKFTPVSGSNDTTEKNQENNENSKTKTISKSASKQRAEPKAPVVATQQQQQPPQTPQSSSVVSSNAENVNQVPIETSSELNVKSIGQKRSSASVNVSNREMSDSQTHESSYNAQSAKMTKLDTSIPITTSEWSVEQVIAFISQLNDNYFASYVDIFRTQEIDGKALVLLTTDILMKYMGFKLGPALKLNNHLEKLRQELRFNMNKVNGPGVNHMSLKTEYN